MKVAFIGQKGIPAKWGGVEFHVDELSRRLKKRGHEVSVYVRYWYTPKERQEYEGVRLLHTSGINTKHLDAATHSFTASVHTLFASYDIIHYHAIGPTLFSWIPRISDKKIVSTIHRFDYDADKWNSPARNILRLSEICALNIPQKTIVVAKHQLKYYKKRGYNPVYIPNGVNISVKIEANVIREKYNLLKNNYILFLGRFVPEKRIEWIINGFRAFKKRNNHNSIKLVLAGGSSGTDKYVKRLKSIADGNNDIIFTGYVMGREKAELLSNTKLFIIPSSLEGLPIALLEAMSYGIPCLASDIPPHREVIIYPEYGFLFQNDSYNNFVENLSMIIQRDMVYLNNIGEQARKMVRKEYDWEDIINKTENLYYSINGSKKLD
ncbi:MAG: glycosyltransferase family 4 protein [Nitrospirota bacterium]